MKENALTQFAKLGTTFTFLSFLHKIFRINVTLIGPFNLYLKF